MKPFTIFLALTRDSDAGELAPSLRKHPLVESVVAIAVGPDVVPPDGAESITADSFWSASLLRRVLDGWATDYAILIQPSERILWGARALERLLHVAADSDAGIVYTDFREDDAGGIADRPLIDYQTGSIRDDFNFGAAFLMSRKTVSGALSRFGGAPAHLAWGALYDLRLKIAAAGKIVHLPEPLYTRVKGEERATGERIFDYVEPSRRAFQIEMEEIATEHLKRIGAFLEPSFRTVPVSGESFPVTASVIIPVRDRASTIGQAVESALSQEAAVSFNVIVVDNHSKDGTSEKLTQLASEHPRLVHLRPSRRDLGIGGCWNEAIYSTYCGKYAVQLDSDDLYADRNSLSDIIGALSEANYAMVVGSYTTVNFDLGELPPGLVDHREWTRENGRNNALRINGLGAPRAFNVGVLRSIGFPNVSYGEDYAVALRISRDYEIGRLYKSVYLARRWTGNSDSALPVPVMNRYDSYKDWVRTQEIAIRQRMNQKSEVEL